MTRKIRGAGDRAFRPRRWMASHEHRRAGRGGQYQPLADEVAVDLRRAFDLSV